MNINSEIIYEAKSKEFGTVGYLVIDKTINGQSFGGIRIVPEMDVKELQTIARSMTYKNAFIDNKIGGAKGAVIISKENEKYRKDILMEYGRCISAFVKNRIFLPVLDMGITLEDLQTIFNGTGHRQDILKWKNMSHKYTAYTCFYSTLSALEKKGISIKDATFAVQGFGNVGSEYTKLMNNAGARMVALSNRYCGIIYDKGLDTNKLILERSLRGDDFILGDEYKKMRVSHDAILEKDLIVLLPASNALVINKKNWKNIKADIIICGANAPISDDIERLLFKNDKIIITDFVANCGGTLGSILDNYVAEETIYHIISTYYKKKVSDLLTMSIESNTPFIDMVIDDIGDKNEKYKNGKYKKDKYLLYMLNLVKKIPNMDTSIDGYLSKKFLSKYKQLWN